MRTRQMLVVARTLLPLSLAAAAFTLVGCATYSMMPTPVLYTGEQAKPLFTDFAADRRTPSLDLLYVTDRAPATGPDVWPLHSRAARATWHSGRRRLNSATRLLGILSSRKARQPTARSRSTSLWDRRPNLDAFRAYLTKSRVSRTACHGHRGRRGPRSSEERDSRPRSNAGSPWLRAKRSCSSSTATLIRSKTPRSTWASCATSLAANSSAPSSAGPRPAARSSTSDTM